MAESWNTTLIFNRPADACPFCGAEKILRVKTAKLRDGKERWNVCKKCSHRWRLRILSPFGNVEKLT